MNCCRTCKWWSVNAHALGMGNCLNLQVGQRVLWPQGFLLCAQDFGCIFHEPGACESSIYSPERECQNLKDFLQDRHQLENVIKP